MTMNKTVLITGVSSGIGRETAQLLAGKGFRVFGTVRNDTASLEGMELVRLDVTDDASIHDAVRAITAKAGPIGSLVNNAGFGLSGALEETSLAEVREQFETNFFGVIRMINAVLPGMREQGYGRIVNISSVAGFLPMPYMGIYAASKHAVEGYTETLSHEIRRFGVHAILVEPDFTRTNFGTSIRTVAANLPAYAAEKAQVLAAIRENASKGTDPRTVAKVIYTALTAASPRQRYPAGGAARLSFLRRFVPAEMFGNSLRKQFRMGEASRSAAVTR
jgi:short-subunit dehydrogenase